MIDYFKPFLKKIIPERARVFLGQLWLRCSNFLLLTSWRFTRNKYHLLKLKDNSLFGVNLVGYLRSMNGLGEAARSSMLALSAANIPFGLLEYFHEASPNQEESYLFEDKITNKFFYTVNLLHVNPPQMPYLWKTFEKKNLACKYNIGVWYWEMQNVPRSWLWNYRVLDEIWVASNFVAESVHAKSPVPVIKIPPVIHVEYEEGVSRAGFFLPKDKFLFLCSFDVHSVQNRKNPEGAIRAFKIAFSSRDSSVGLVIKINNAKHNKEGVHRLKDELRDYLNCYFIEESYSRKKFNLLLSLVDAYISLHRSEGFGLVPAEAMYLGKPVVVTNWSGTTDFANQENSCAVDYQLIPVGPNNPPYSPDEYWADPDIEQAADYMNKLYSDRIYYNKISKSAIQTIHNLYSLQVVSAMVKERLNEVS